MSALLRGARNALRNPLRTGSVLLILTLSMALALAMLLSYQSVTKRITSVRSSVGTTITVRPAGSFGFEGGGEPLTVTQQDQVAALAHVTSVQASLMERVQAGTDTNLVSSIELGSLGARRGGATSGSSQGSQPSLPGAANFTPPMTVQAVSNPAALLSSSFSISDGSLFNAVSAENVAVIGTALAAKNGLTIGSTFTLFDETVVVQAIFDAGNQFSNAGIYLPITTLQQLSDRVGEIDSLQVVVDDIANTEGVVKTIQTTLGSDVVDVTSDADLASSTLQPLENIQSMSLYGVFGALGTGAVITLLIMVMVVRERRREIGTLKAIGASNASIVTQFVSEALVLTSISGVLGIITGTLTGNSVLSALLTSSNSTTVTTGEPGRGMGRMLVMGGNLGSSVRDAMTNLQVDIGIPILLYGIGAILLVALLGSALPAWFIAKIRPAEVLRGE